MRIRVYGNNRSGYKAHGENCSKDPELRACPFCGNKNILIENSHIEHYLIENSHTPHYWAKCENCGCQKEGLRIPGDEPYLDRQQCIDEHKLAFDSAIKESKGGISIGGYQ